MTHELSCLAADLGAESGRVMLGRFDGERLRTEEVHRFANQPVFLPDGLHWDVLNLFTQVKEGVSQAVRSRGSDLISLGVDTWAEDFGLLDATGALVLQPYHYRDARTESMLEEAFRRLPRREVYELTGIQVLSVNTLFQLLAMVVSRSPVLDIAHTFLTIPDLLNYWLTGVVGCEFTNATTTQCYDPRRGEWSWPLLEAMDIPAHMFPSIIPPGTVLGLLSPWVARETGAVGLRLVAPACHDTGSAVVGVPAVGKDFAFISAGTWSVLGTELSSPLINEQSFSGNFTNEGGVGDTFRFERDIMGLWLVQECRRAWAAQGRDYDYSELTRLAAAAAPLCSVVDPDCDDFLRPGDMVERIRGYCRRTGQSVPESEGAVVRCVLESLALKSRWVLERLEAVLGRRFPAVHIVGGGARNQLLCQFTADATGRPVLAGPAEATAVGNLLVQLIGLGELGSLEEARHVARRSFDLLTYEPGSPAAWDEAYTVLERLIEEQRENG